MNRGGMLLHRMSIYLKSIFFGRVQDEGMDNRTLTEDYKDRVSKAYAVARVIGNPATMSLMELIGKRPGMIINELVALTTICQADVSSRLITLELCGLIRKEKTGREVQIYPNVKRLQRVINAIKANATFTSDEIFISDNRANLSNVEDIALDAAARLRYRC